MLTAIPNGTATVPCSHRAAYNIIVCFMANVIILWVKKTSKMDNDKHIIQIVEVTHKKGNVSKESEIIYVANLVQLR